MAGTEYEYSETLVSSDCRCSISEWISPVNPPYGFARCGDSFAHGLRMCVLSPYGTVREHIAPDLRFWIRCN